MGKTSLIIQREYFSRVKKKSFIIMTILGPILFAALFIVPVFLANVEPDMSRVVIVDDTAIEGDIPMFAPAFKNTDKIRFIYSPVDIHRTKAIYKDSSVAVLHIGSNILNGSASGEKSVNLFSSKVPSATVQSHISRVLQAEIEKQLLLVNNVNPEIIKNIKQKVNVIPVDFGSNLKSDELNFVVGFAFAVLIYLFIFLYSAQVMRGVIEEKTNRIVEVIISSVKPFQLMMGKIVGVALVGLTQFVLWVLLSTVIIFGAKSFLSERDFEKVVNQRTGGATEVMVQQKPSSDKQNMNKAVDEMMANVNRINWPFVVGCFVFYFLGGYLLYSALFAAIGSAVDNETETQQFMLPVTIPLILSFVMAQTVIRDPDGQVAFWLSIIPLTSPVIMMVRIAFFNFTEDWWQLALSMGLLVIGFVFTTWLAGRIYRTGILMYGKKVTYKELWKWLFYKG